MSSSPLNLPILISQLPYVQQIAHIEMAKPEVQQALYAPLINENIKKDGEKVQNVDKKEKTDPVDRDGRGNQQQHADGDRKEKMKDPDDDPETGASSASPWTGNIVNVKI